ncbi:MAG: MBL fold metallo-hydrolase [Clostridiales bacterium]|nr:MBL fold metallo-hydrolase [Clostridiales bacterium]
MKLRRLLSAILVFTLLFTLSTPALAAAPTMDAASSSAVSVSGFTDFFQNILKKIKDLFMAIKFFFDVIKTRVPNTMNKNAVHMLRSVTDTIGDSFIITTDDGKVIVIDGGQRTETPYFIRYLKTVTGQKRPHIDAWFLSHPHDDHCEVFLEIVEKHGREVTFDKVYANFPEASFYEGEDEWAVTVLTDYYRLMPRFSSKAEELHEGDVFNIGTAKFTVFYTFNPEWKLCNSASTIMRMDLGKKRVMFTGDAYVNSGNYVVEKYGESGELRSDICKMAHHGQDGVDRNFYEAVSPEVCLWPTPSWVWDNTNGNLKTLEVRAWMEELDVKENHVAKDGSYVLYLD